VYDMSYSSVAGAARKPFMGHDPRVDLQPEGERFTPLCSRDARRPSAKKRQRGEEAFSAICFPGWNKD